MITIKISPEFEKWLKSIKDKITRIRLTRRLDKIQRGNWGDVKHVQDNIWEIREFFGPGYRMYYLKHNDTIIIMLGGGDKSSQQKDIKKAIALVKTLED